MKTGPLAGVMAVLALGASGALTRMTVAAPIACEALSHVPIAGGIIPSTSMPASAGSAVVLPAPAGRVRAESRE